jgi:hypothetical protein
MSPILGIIASSNFQRVTSSYESIATATVGSGGSSGITFSSIPQTYTHLQIRMIARNSSSSDAVRGQFNSDTTAANYSGHLLYGDGTSAGAAAATSFGKFGAGYQAQSSTTAGTFGVSVLDILDYTSTSKGKTTRFLGGYDANGTGSVGLFSSGYYASPAAITSIYIFPDSANFTQYSSFALYGIKGA